jgi:hypothetical protein
MKRVLFTCQLVAVLAASVLFAQTLAAQEQSGKAKECSNATLRGNFGYTSTGTLLDSFVPPPFAGPFAEVGRETFDGKGNTDATGTLSANGNVFSKVTFEGTYAVNPDCTGSMTLSSSLGVSHADFVIDDDGTELRLIFTDSGVIESRVYKKQLR